jgi:hypothetical protein
MRNHFSKKSWSISGLSINKGGLGSKGLCGIPYKKFFKIPKKLFFVTFCIGDYKSLAAIAALPQWPVRPSAPEH